MSGGTVMLFDTAAIANLLRNEVSAEAGTAASSGDRNDRVPRRHVDNA
jgi:hypothetical protein